jgi:hypothetical protein
MGSARIMSRPIVTLPLHTHPVLTHPLDKGSSFDRGAVWYWRYPQICSIRNIFPLMYPYDFVGRLLEAYPPVDPIPLLRHLPNEVSVSSKAQAICGGFPDFYESP